MRMKGFLLVAIAGAMVSGTGCTGTSPAGADDAGSSCAGGCLVGTSCVAAGESNPENPCEICRPAASATAFSPNDGARCDDGAFCTVEDTCMGGTCVGAARDCDDRISCNGEETCDEAQDACVAGSPSCEAGAFCDAVLDTCVLQCPGCAIGGTCYGAGQTNPMDPCDVCDPTASRAAWTVNVGASCDDGLFCTTGDACEEDATCSGTARACDDGVSCNGAETCNEALDRCDPGTSTCAPGTLCTPGTDSCAPDCATGLTVCNQLCIDTAHDAANCGGCGTSCARDHAIAQCASALCEFACLAGFGDCDGQESNGCETPLDTVTNCGVCGNACAGSAPCVNGVCQPPPSVSGIVYADLDADGTRDPGEGAIAGRVVYLDANANGTLDTGELWATSDATGAWIIEPVPNGSYTLREVQDWTYFETAPGTYQEFADSFSGPGLDPVWIPGGNGISLSGGLLTLARDDASDSLELGRTIGSRFEVTAVMRLDIINWNDTYHGLELSTLCSAGQSGGFQFGFAKSTSKFVTRKMTSCPGSSYNYPTSYAVGTWYTVTAIGVGGTARVAIGGQEVDTASYAANVPLELTIPGRYNDGDGTTGNGATQSSWDSISIRDSQPGGFAIVVSGSPQTGFEFGNR